MDQFELLEDRLSRRLDAHAQEDVRKFSEVREDMKEQGEKLDKQDEKIDNLGTQLSDLKGRLLLAGLVAVPILDVVLKVVIDKVMGK